MTAKIPCPECGAYESKVTNSRTILVGPKRLTGLRRRRECLACHTRFTTLETFLSRDLRQYPPHASTTSSSSLSR